MQAENAPGSGAGGRLPGNRGRSEPQRFFCHGTQFHRRLFEKAERNTDDRRRGASGICRSGRPQAVRGTAAADDLLQSVHLLRRPQSFYSHDAGTDERGRRSRIHYGLG